jgi:hypothetical protein
MIFPQTYLFRLKNSRLNGLLIIYLEDFTLENFL